MIKFLLSLLPFISMPALRAAEEPEDIELLATVLTLEAGGEGRDGMWAVACVIRNRAIKSGYSHTVEVKRPFQFSCLNGGITQAVAKARNSKVYWMALQVASQMSFNRIWYDTTWGATHYENRWRPKPSWARDMKVTTTIGNHTFYRRKKK